MLNKTVMLLKRDSVKVGKDHSGEFEVRILVGETDYNGGFKKIYAERTFKFQAKELNDVFEKVSLELPEI